jgi:hypothetical protein
MAYDRTLIQIRERSFLDLMDLALVVVRLRPRALALAAVAGIAPFAVLNAWLLSTAENRWARCAVLLFLEAPWATAPLTMVLGGLMFDQPPRPGPVLARIIRGLPSLVLVHLILRGFLGMTFLLIPLVPARLWFASEVILLEQTAGLRAVRRSARLCTDRSGEFVSFAIVQLLFGLTFALCFWTGTGAALSTFFDRSLTWEQPYQSSLDGIRFQIGVWIAIAFFSIARFLIYIDQRIRSEGWELKLRLRAVGLDMDEGRA